MKETACLDVKQVIDDEPLGKYHLRIGILCAASVLMDGFDAQSIGFVAPVLAQQWHIQRATMSLLLTSGLLGMLIGALVFGPLADRFGRKRILVLCSLWFGVFSLLTARADSVQSMLLLRVITGFGLGGTLPNAIALTSEYMPTRLRATGVMLMFCGYSVGAASGGLVAAALISHFGWRSVFIVGGVLPCALAVLLLQLPESIRFLVLKGGEDDRIARILRQVAPRVSIPDGTSFVSAEERHAGFVVKQLFTEGRGAFTLLLWAIFFLSLLELYFFNSWLPTVIHDAGLALERAIVIAAMFHVGGAAGVIMLGRLIDRKTSYQVLAWAYLGASAAVFFIGIASASVVLLTLAVATAGWCVVGAQTGANALAAEFYPTAIRSTGVGWALGIGRIGSIVGPMVGGVLLSSKMKITSVFWVAAVPPILAAVGALAVSRLQGRRSAQEVHAVDAAHTSS